MKTVQPEEGNPKNRQLSLALIALNSVLVFAVLQTGRQLDGNDKFLKYGVLVLTGILLVGGFAITYHGKVNRWAKWLLGLLLIVGALLFVFSLYVSGLAAAFKN